MKKHQFLIIVLLAMSLLSSGRPRHINVIKEIKTAKFIGFVEVQNYSFYKKATNEKQPNDNCLAMINKIQVRDIINDSTFSSVTLNEEGVIPSYKLIDYEQLYYTGNWPNLGDTVLIIIDSSNIVSVFGVKYRNKFRIWSPYLTGSLAIFEIVEPLVEPLSLVSDDFFCGYPAPHGGHHMICSDGCLLTTKNIKRIIEKDKIKLLVDPE